MTTSLIEQKYSSDLTYKQWKILEPYIPEVKPGGRPRAHPMWEIINAISYTEIIKTAKIEKLCKATENMPFKLPRPYCALNKF